MHSIEIWGIAFGCRNIFLKLNLHKIGPSSLAAVNLVAQMRGERRDGYRRFAKPSIESNERKPHSSALASSRIYKIILLHLRTTAQPIDGPVYREDGSIVEIFLSAGGDAGTRVAGLQQG